MRILIYSYNYWPEPIGIAPLMTELAEGLVKRGHQVRVVTAMPHYPKGEIYPRYRCQLFPKQAGGNRQSWPKLFLTEARRGVTIQRCWLWVRSKKRRLLDRILLDGTFVFTSIFQAIRGWRPDVILYTTPPLPVSVPAAILGWLWGCPIVLNLQDILPEAAIHVGLLRNQALIQVFSFLEKFAYKTATRISVITDLFTANLQSKGVPKDKIVCIPNWVDVQTIRPLPRQENPFRQLHQLGDRFLVLYSGNIALTQPLEIVVAAAVRLQHTFPQIQFLIVGELAAIREIEQLCQFWNAKTVQCLPFQSLEMFPHLLAAADVGLVLQRRNVIAFNMPSKIQKILASGRPIIASVPPQGSADRAICTSQGGLVIAPEDPEALAEAVVRLYQNPGLAEDLGRKGRAYAEANYSFETCLQAYEGLFHQLIAQKTQRTSLAKLLQFINFILVKLGLGNVG